MNNILICFGTRPEWLKVKPLIKKIPNYKLLFTGQHKDLLKHIKPDYEITIKQSSNRLDSVIQFDFLSKKVMKSIVDKAINILDGQLAEKNISISLSNSAKDYLIDEGYDRKFGARPLERLIQKKIKEPLADEIIFGKLKKGGKVIVEFNKEQLKIKLTK